MAQTKNQKKTALNPYVVSTSRLDRCFSSLLIWVSREPPAQQFTFGRQHSLVGHLLLAVSATEAGSRSHAQSDLSRFFLSIL